MQAESKRIPLSFGHVETIWNNRSAAHKNSDLPSRVIRGYSAYAHKQAAMYKDLRCAANLELNTVQRKVIPVLGLGGGINPFVRP